MTTLRLSEDVSIDLGPGEELVGIEVLSASEDLGLERGAHRIKLANVQGRDEIGPGN